MSENKVAYYSNMIWDLDNSDDMHLVLAQSKIDKDTAENMESAMKLVYEDGVAKEVIWMKDGEYHGADEARFISLPITYVDYPIRDYKTIVLDAKGQHFLGGEAPNDFGVPTSICDAPFVYLGKLDCQIEASLSWTELDKFHIVCPIHADMDVMFLDYKNPNHPKIINQEKVDKYTSQYEALNNKDSIIFEQTPFSFKNIKLDLTNQSEIIGNIGAPSWVQQELIPRCPKTGNPMEFLISLASNKLVELNTSTVKVVDEFMEHYVNTFNFWHDGVLFVFYSPDSKVAAYFIQNT
jgi:hypothetical protein